MISNIELDDKGYSPRSTCHDMFSGKCESQCLLLNFTLLTFPCQEAIQHPVIRMLVIRKWKKFGHWWFW